MISEKSLALIQSAFEVLYKAVGNRALLLHNIAIFKISNRSRRQVNKRGHTAISPAAQPDRPFDCRAFSHARLPFGTRLREIVGPVESRSGAIDTMNDRDRHVGQFQFSIDLLDRRIVPVPDLAKKNVGKQRPGKAHRARQDTFDMYHRNDAADDERELAHAELAQFFRLERHVARTEIDQTPFGL